MTANESEQGSNDRSGLPFAAQTQQRNPNRGEIGRRSRGQLDERIVHSHVTGQNAVRPAHDTLASHEPEEERRTIERRSLSVVGHILHTVYDAAVRRHAVNTLLDWKP